MAEQAGISWEEARLAAVEGRLERVLVACDRSGGARYHLAVRPGPALYRLVQGPDHGCPELAPEDRFWVVELLTGMGPKDPDSVFIAPF